MPLAEICSLNSQFAQQTPRERVRDAIARFERIGVAFSGAEDIMLVDLAVKARKEVCIFTLDTGRLHPETYRFLEKVNTHYGIQIEVLFPEASAVERLVTEKGLYSFYKDGHTECCQIRKVAPLQRKLASLDVWMTGQRQDQSSTRKTLAAVELDTQLGEDRPLIKINPLFDQRSQAVWDYIRVMELPYNPLHQQGFVSIGCEPCTRPVLPHQSAREGRWWWEEEAHKECGLHIINTP